MSICDNYKLLLKKISNIIVKNKIDNSNVNVLAVSKNHSIYKLISAINCGVTMFGESRIQEAIPKIEKINSLYNNIDFHFIGRIQTNKIKKIVEYFSLIHSVDRIDVLYGINEKAEQLNKIQNILLQINVSKEQQKGGIFVENIESLLNETSKLKNVLLKGFMMMPPNTDNPEDNRKYFTETYKIFDKYKKYGNFNLELLSMGMSDDFDIAISEGANLIRIGSMIFGER